jgi:hypothetical protein
MFGVRNMNMGWFTILQTVKEESESPNPKDYGNQDSLHPAASRRVSLINLNGLQAATHFV